jgi:muconolactone delta-isomerase
MKILALERDKPGATDADFVPHLKAEAARAYELYQQGVLRELYFHREEQTAVLILEAESLEAADRILATLPLVKAGLISFELIPLVPYSGLPGYLLITLTANTRQSKIA